MNCQTFEAEMYNWRPGCDVTEFKTLFEHIAACPECAYRFARLNEMDQDIRDRIRQIPETPTLNARIMAGLAHERRKNASFKRRWPLWAFVLSVAAMLLLTVWLGVMPRVRETQFEKQVAALLSRPPQEQITSSDQKELLSWSAAELGGSGELPPKLRKVTFRSASALSLGQHPAVLLKMKNEQRASLLVVSGVLTQGGQLRSFVEADGSGSHWSEGGKTYVVLFKGSEQDLNAYMQKMGIAA
jgi:anti-sigma factor RsiW